MNSSLARKIEKAKQYAFERERFCFNHFEINFRGNNHQHVVSYADQSFQCDCEYFANHKYCSHTLALEKLLTPMVPERLD